MGDTSRFAEGHHPGGDATLVGERTREPVNGQSTAAVAAVEKRAGFDLVGYENVHLVPRKRYGACRVGQKGCRLHENTGTATARHVDRLANGRHWKLESQQHRVGVLEGRGGGVHSLWRDGNIVVDVPDDGGISFVADETEADRGRDVFAGLNPPDIDPLAC